MDVHVIAILSAVAVYTALFACLYVLYYALETYAPAERGHTLRGRARNAAYTFFYILLGGIALYGIGLLVPSLSERSVDLGLVGLVGVAFLNLFLADLLFYWYHRAEHTYS